jgi:hypothetical protein
VKYNLIIPSLHSQAKISYLHFVVLTLVSDLVDEDIVRLDVSVDDSLLLEEVKHKENLLHYESYFKLRKLLALFK